MQINFQAGVEDIYDACVAKGSTPASTSLSDVVQGIMAIPTGITPSGTISITSNNTYDVTNYASANVAVPTGITPSGTKSITANGTYDISSYQKVKVSVSKSVKVGIRNQGSRSVAIGHYINGSYKGYTGFEPDETITYTYTV